MSRSSFTVSITIDMPSGEIVETFENISNTDNTFPDETKRLIYVALSRPKHLLAMAFPESITNKELSAI